MITEPGRLLQVEETEGESFIQHMLLPENNYDNSIYRQGFIYNFGGYDMSNDGIQWGYSSSELYPNDLLVRTL